MVKIIAKANTWFKEGTEVFYETTHNWNARTLEECERLSLEEYTTIREEARQSGWNAGCFKGLRVTQNPLAEGGGNIGDERVDGEVCQWDEFDVLILNKK